MQKLGYQANFWHMRSDDYGAALVQGKVCTVYYRKDVKHQGMKLGRPEPMLLPVRGMSNLLKPMGVPQKAY